MAIETVPAATPIITPDLRQHVLDSYPADAARIDRAVELVQRGHVERTARPGQWLVVSRTVANRAYHVSAAGCDCEDYRKRGGHCLHQYAVELFCYAERAEAEPTLDVDAPVPFALTDLAYLVLDGEPCALPAQCPRCHAEAAILTHRDHLGARCLADELFGTDPAA